MDTTQRAGLMQRWHVIQAELIPDLGREVEGLTPRLVKSSTFWNEDGSKFELLIRLPG